jgi:hypothetical protein
LRPDDEQELSSRLEQVIAGRCVSVVGNASSLLGSRHGALIDSGCVLRMNAGIPVKRAAQGQQVDIHCFSNRPSLEMNIRRRRRHLLLRRRSDFFEGALSIWMGLDARELCDDPRQLFYPKRLAEQLSADLGARPSTGIAVLQMLSEAPPPHVRIFGFDFKATTTYYRKNENRGPHDWEAERRLALSIIGERGWEIFP